MSAAYAHNSEVGASASGSSYTFNTSNSASTGVGTDNPINDYYDSPFPGPNVYVPANSYMSGSGSSWYYLQTLIAVEAQANSTLTGTPPGGHDIGSASSSEVITLGYSNFTVTARWGGVDGVLYSRYDRIVRKSSST